MRIRTMLSRTTGLAAAAALLMLGQAAWAEDEINPDRPDFVDSPEVVGKGRLQLEMGVNLQRDKNAGLSTRARSLPTMLRLGLSEDWELRLESELLVRERSSFNGASNTLRGTGDLALSAKWHWMDGDEQAGTPALGWVFQLDTDSGSSALRGRGMRPQARFVSEWSLAGDVSVGLMAGIYRDRNDADQRYWGGLLGLGASAPLGEKLRGFAELAAQRLASRRNEGRQASFDIGLSYQLTPDLQLDTLLARGLTRSSPDLSWGLGLSVRY